MERRGIVPIGWTPAQAEVDKEAAINTELHQVGIVPIGWTPASEQTQNPANPDTKEIPAELPQPEIATTSCPKYF